MKIIALTCILYFITFVNCETFFVSSTGDDTNAGTARAAPLASISQAVALAADGDTIMIIGTGVFTGALNQNLDISQADLTITSEEGPENVVVDFETSAAPFLTHTVLGTSQLTVENLTFFNSSGPSIVASRVSMNIRNCVFDQCFADGTLRFTSCFDVNIEDTVFTSTAIAVTASATTVSIRSSTFLPIFEGVVMSFQSVDLVLDDCSFQSTVSTRVYTEANGNIDITDCSFDGVALTHHDSPVVKIRRSSFANVLYTTLNAAVSSSGEILIEDCLFESNDRAVFLSPLPSNFIVRRSTFRNNGKFGLAFPGGSTRILGAAMELDANGVVADCVFEGNMATSGGAISQLFRSQDQISYVHFRRCQFIGNLAQSYGGAMAITNTRITDCTFINNNAGEVRRGELALGENVGWCLNRFACAWAGGAIMVRADVFAVRPLTFIERLNRLVVEDSRFVNNSVTYTITDEVATTAEERRYEEIYDLNNPGWGGAIAAESLQLDPFSRDQSVFIKNTTFEDNYADSAGGAIYINNGTSVQGYEVCEDCTFINNEAKSYGDDMATPASDIEAEFSNKLDNFQTATFKLTAVDGFGQQVANYDSVVVLRNLEEPDDLQIALQEGTIQFEDGEAEVKATVLGVLGTRNDISFETIDYTRVHFLTTTVPTSIYLISSGKAISVCGV